MQIKHLEYFIAVAETQSINQAAQNLFVSQQALSASLNAFEAELGYPVLERSKKGATLTPLGILLLEEAKEIVDKVEQWKERKPTEETDVNHHFVLSIAAPTALCNSVLPDIIYHFQQLEPYIEVHVYEARGAKLFQHCQETDRCLIINGYTKQDLEKVDDIALTLNLSAELLLKDEMYLFFNPSNPYAKQKSVKVNQLKDFTLASYPKDEQFPYLHLHSKFNTERTYRSTLTENLFSMISKDSSLAIILPGIESRNNPYIETGKLISLPISGANLPFSFYIFHGKELLPQESNFIHFMQEYLHQK